MKKVLSLIIAAVMLMTLCACTGNTAEDTQPGETTQPQVNTEATAQDKAHLESLYQGRAVCYGDLHAHSNSSEQSDGKHTLAAWKAHLAENQIDFATIVDHHQVVHMWHDDWDDTVFIGGSEPGMHVIGTEVASKNNIHYAMIFTKAEGFEAFLNTYPMEYQYAGGYYKGSLRADHAKIAELIQCIKDNGGMFTYVHPAGKDGYYDPVDVLHHWFADGTGFEVANSLNGGFGSECDTKAYEYWVTLLNAGKRIWATTGSDAHASLPRPDILSTLYAEEKNADGYYAQMRAGNLTAGPVGIRIAVGDAVTGGVGGFDGNRVVVAVGDFHPLAVKPDHTYRLDLYDETGLVVSRNISSAEMNYFAFDARTDAKYYRANVYDVTEDRIIAIGNPIWNAQ